MSDELTLEGLQSEPKINGRKRYHRNMKERAFNRSNQKMDFFKGGQMFNFDEICCKVAL